MNQGIPNPGPGNPNDEPQHDLEVESTDLQAFESKVAALMQHPKSTEETLKKMGLPEAEISESDNPYGSWRTFYRKGNILIHLSMPQPGSTTAETVATAETPTQVDTEGNITWNEETFTSYQATQSSYLCQTIIRDKSGKKIPGPHMSPKDIFDAFQLEKSLGENILTKKRFKELMGLLTSLSPEDEIIISRER